MRWAPVTGGGWPLCDLCGRVARRSWRRHGGSGWPAVASGARRARLSVHMKAVVYDRYGPPEILRIEEVARPVPRDDEVVVRVRAATVNRFDCHTREANRSNGLLISGPLRRDAAEDRQRCPGRQRQLMPSLPGRQPRSDDQHRRSWSVAPVRLVDKVEHNGVARRGSRPAPAGHNLTKASLRAPAGPAPITDCDLIPDPAPRGSLPSLY